jgi:hypothetical protein
MGFPEVTLGLPRMPDKLERAFLMVASQLLLVLGFHVSSDGMVGMLQFHMAAVHEKEFPHARSRETLLAVEFLLFVNQLVNLLDVRLQQTSRTSLLCWHFLIEIRFVQDFPDRLPIVPCSFRYGTDGIPLTVHVLYHLYLGHF